MFLACFRDWTPFLVPGETGRIIIIAADRRQSRVIFGYCLGFLENIPMLSGMILRQTQDTLDLAMAWRHDDQATSLRKLGIIGAHDPDRKRELGEVEIDLGTEQRRIRVSHDPQDRTMNLHGVNVRLADLDPGLARSFEATAAEINRVQGQAEQEDQRTLLAALLDRILRRHKWAADALVRQLQHERFTAV